MKDVCVTFEGRLELETHVTFMNRQEMVSVLNTGLVGVTCPLCHHIGFLLLRRGVLPDSSFQLFTLRVLALHLSTFK
jgi:hypothetical protein